MWNISAYFDIATILYEVVIDSTIGFICYSFELAKIATYNGRYYGFLERRKVKDIGGKSLFFAKKIHMSNL